MTEREPSTGGLGASTTSERAAWNTLANVGGTAVTVGTWFFLTPFILHHIGATAYGLWVLVAALVSYGSLLDLGVGVAVTKYVAEYNARGETERIRRLVATAFWLHVCFGLVAVAIAVLLAPLTPRLFDVPAADVETAEWLTIVSGIAVAVELPASTAYSVLRGLEKFPSINVVSVFGMALVAIAVVLALTTGAGIIGLVLASTAATILMQMPMFYVVRRSLPGVGIRLRDVDRRLARTMVRFGSSLFLIDVSGRMTSSSDEIVIAAFLPVSRVTPYAIARRISTLPRMLAQQFVSVLMPMASQLEARQDRQSVQRLAVAGVRLTLVCFLTPALGLVVLADPFISAWIGPEYADAATLVLILVVSSVISVSIFPLVEVLQAMTKHRPIAVFSFVAALANVGLSILLIRPFGVTGVALGTLIATAAEVVLLVIPYALRTTGVSLGAMLREAIGPALVPAVPALGALYVLREWLDPSTLIGVLTLGAAGGVVYLAGYVQFFARAGEREAVRALGTRAVRRLRAAI